MRSYLRQSLLGLFLFAIGSQALAVSSTCGIYGDDTATHYVEPGVWEMASPAYEIDGYSQLTGVNNGSLYAPPAPYPYIIQWYTLPVGTSHLYGDSWSWIFIIEGTDPEPYGYWVHWDTDDCDRDYTVTYCETENIVPTGGGFSATSEIFDYLTEAMAGGLALLENIDTCSASAPPSFSGSIDIVDIEQCCEAEQRVDTAQAVTGSASFFVPSISCHMKTFPLVSVPVVVLEGTIAAGLTADMGVTGINGSLCGQNYAPVYEGSIYGSFGGELGIGAIDTQILSFDVDLNGGVGVTFEGPHWTQLTIEGCVGPGQITGNVTVLGQQVQVFQIDPPEKPAGLKSCTPGFE